MSKIKNQLLPLILSVLILSFLTAYWIFAWDEPGSSPPLGNVAAPINTGSTAQTKSGALTVTTLTTSGGVLYLDDSTEGNIQRVNAVIGYDDLFLKSNSSENAIVYIAGSEISFWSGGAERWEIDTTGSLTKGSVPWARLTSFPSDCASGEYVSGIGSTLTCSAPAGGLSQCSDCDSTFVNETGDTMTGNLTVGSGGAGYVYLGNRGYYIGDDLGGTDIQTNASNFYVYDGGWKRLLRDGDSVGIEGGGTLNYVSKFTDTGTIGNSQIFDNGTNVGIGTATPAQKLEVVNGGYVIFHEGFWGQATGDGEDTDIWGISSSFYPSHGTAAARYGIKWDNTDDRITFVGGGTTRAYVDLNDGNTYFSGNVGIATTPRTDTYKLSMGGSIHMNNNDINYVSQLHFNDNVRFYDDGNDNYLNFKYGDTGAGGIKIYDGDTQLQGYLYASGGQQFGLLDGDSNWSYHLVKDDYTRFLINNSEKVRITSAGDVGIGDSTPDYKLDVAGSVGLDGDLTVGGGDITGKNSEWIDIGEAQADSVQISNHLIIGANDTIDDDTTIGGTSDDWISFSGYIEMRSNTDNYGIVLRDKDATNYLALTQVDGYSYLSDSNTYSNYFLRGGGDDVRIKDDLTVGDNLIATSNTLSNCAWECAGGEGAAGEFYNVCNDGKVAAGIKIKKTYWFPIWFVYNVCVYCCEL